MNINHLPELKASKQLVKEKANQSSSLNNRYMHLTNIAVQKHGKNFGVLKEGNIMSMEEVADYFKGKMNM